VKCTDSRILRVKQYVKTFSITYSPGDGSIKQLSMEVDNIEDILPVLENIYTREFAFVRLVAVVELLPTRDQLPESDKKGLGAANRPVSPPCIPKIIG